MQRLRRGLTVGLVLLLIVAMAVPAFANDLKKQQAEYERIQKEIEQMEKKINQNAQQSKSVTSEITRLDKEIQKTEEQLNYLENRLKTTALEIQVTEQDLAESEEQLGFRQEMLKTRLRALYERGSASYLEVLFNAQSFSDLINRVGMLQRVVAQDVTIVDSIKIEKARIEQQKEILEAKRMELSSLHRQTENNRTAVASRMAERTRYKDQLAKDRSVWQKSLRELEVVEKNMERLIREAQSKNPGSGAGTGSYVWPTPGYTKINSPFGSRRDPIFGGTSFHYGIDIGAPSGARILAADSATVLFSGVMTGYGNVVILDHGNSRSTVYAHCSVLLVKNNQKVAKGQQIAKVGSTGWSTGPHLHFEFRIKGAKQNPLNYVKRP